MICQFEGLIKDFFLKFIIEMEKKFFSFILMVIAVWIVLNNLCSGLAFKSTCHKNIILVPISLLLQAKRKHFLWKCKNNGKISLSLWLLRIQFSLCFGKNKGGVTTPKEYQKHQTQGFFSRTTFLITNWILCWTCGYHFPENQKGGRKFLLLI